MRLLISVQEAARAHTRGLGRAEVSDYPKVLYETNYG